MSKVVGSLAQMLGSIILMFVLNAKLTGVLLVFVPVIFFGAVLYGKSYMGNI